MHREDLIAVISEDSKFLQRADLMSSLLPVRLRHFQDADRFSDEVEKDPALKDIVFVLVSAIQIGNGNEIAGMMQVVKFGLPAADIAVVVDKKIDTATAEFVKKSGASVVVLEDEYYQNSKIEFIVSRKVHGEWISLKTSDISKNTAIDFTLYHLMPLNQKYLAILQKGQVVDEEHLKKYNSVGELYIKREDLDNYKKYLVSAVDMSAEGLRRRCRADYLRFVDSYKSLVMLLTDQSEASSFEAGRQLFQRLNQMAGELISSLGALGEPWSVINNSKGEDFTAIDRAPALSSYAGMLSLALGIGKPEEVMVAALIADIGLLDLSNAGVSALRSGDETALNDEDRKIYRRHPIISINKALSRKVALPEKLKDIILNTHERADQKGFPHQPEKSKIPAESFLIHFSEMLDRLTVLDFGRARLSPQEARKAIVAREISPEKGGSLPFGLLQNIDRLDSN